jgi:thioredoxin
METASKTESFGEVIKGAKPVLIDFYAVWCGPCKMMTPILKELREKTGDKLRILKIDIDKNPAVAEAFQIQGVPTLILFQNGKILWRESGVIPADQLQKVISRYTTAA